jgi:hypothetical protein
MDLEPLFHAFHSKIYIFGYLYHRAPTPQTSWVKVWAEIWGDVLVIWKVPEIVLSQHRACYFDAQKYLSENLHPSEQTLSLIKKSNPFHVNLLDSVCELLSNLETCYSGPMPPAPFSSYFAICSSSSQVHHFASYSTLTANEWIVAMRLSEFEQQKLLHCHSMQLLHESAYKECWTFFKTEPWNIDEKTVYLEAIVQLKFTFSSEWKEFLLVISSTKMVPTEAVKKSRKLTKEAIMGVETSERAQILFYEPGMDPKKTKPVYFLPAPVSIAALWPEKATLIGTSSIGKIDGAIFPVPSDEIIRRSKEKLDYTTGYQYIDQMSIREIDLLSDKRPIPSFTLFMAKNVVEMLKIIVGTSLAFKLDLDYQKIHQEISVIDPKLSKKQVSSFSSGNSASDSTEEGSTEEERHSSGYEQSTEDSCELSDAESLKKTDETTEESKSSSKSMSEDEFPNQIVRPKPKAITQPLNKRLSINVQTNQLFLMTSEVSGLSMYHEKISMVDPLSKLLKLKSDFNAVWALKMQAKSQGLLHEWENMTRKNLAQRKVLEEKAARAKLNDWIERFDELSKSDSPTHRLQTMFPKIHLRDTESDDSEDSEESDHSLEVIQPNF